MKKVLSFIANDSFLNKLENGWETLDKIIKDNKLDGIETMTGGFYDPKKVEKVRIIGSHFIYFPSWLHMWFEDKKELEKEYGTLKYAANVFGGFGKKRLVELYRQEIEDAILLGAEYIVFHVGHVGLEEIFKNDFKYKDDIILENTISLINEIFKTTTSNNNVILLFENLWWPGMNLLDEKKTIDFLEKIKYKNKGIMLDISHFILTNSSIKDYKDFYRYFQKKILVSPSLVNYIRGIHLNSTFPSKYIKNGLEKNKNKFLLANKRKKKYEVAISHITNLDTHNIYEDFSINKIIKKLNIEFLVYEFKWSNQSELVDKIKKQNLFIHHHKKTDYIKY